MHLPSPRNFLNREALLGFLRSVVTFALRTIVPSLLFLFAPLYFFSEGIFAVVVWAFLLLAWLFLLASVEWIRGASREAWQMELRQVLASFRKLTNNVTNRIIQARSAEMTPTETLLNAYDHDILMAEIMGAVFYVISGGNQDLERHIRVTFMEVHDNALWVKYYASTDNEPPATMSAGECFREGEGVAGQAWSRNDLVIDPDVERSGIFAPKTEAHRHFAIKSLASIPVDLWDAGGENRRVIGVLNVDSDQINYFRDTGSGQRQIAVTLRPYVRLIRLLYVTRQALEGSQ